jgi:hypothetical protein
MTQTATCDIIYKGEKFTATFEWEMSEPAAMPSLNDPGEPGWGGQCDDVTDLTDHNGDSIFDELDQNQINEIIELINQTFDEADFFSEF